MRMPRTFFLLHDVRALKRKLFTAIHNPNKAGLQALARQTL